MLPRGWGHAVFGSIVSLLGVLTLGTFDDAAGSGGVDRCGGFSGVEV